MKIVSAQIQRRDEPREVPEDANAAMPDGVGDRRADTDRRVVHHDVRELEHRLGNGLAPGDERPAFLTDHPERDREDDAEDHDLQHVTVGHRLDDRLGNDVQQDLIPRLRGRRDPRLLAHRQIDANPWPHHVDGDEADDEREGRDHLEVDDGAQSDPSDDLDVPGPGDPGNQRREDQRCDDHLDQPQEDLAEGAEVRRRGGVVLADEPADDDADAEPDENLLGKRQAASGRPFGLRMFHPIDPPTWAGVRRFYPKDRDASGPRAASGRLRIAASSTSGSRTGRPTRMEGGTTVMGESAEDTGFAR